MSVIQPDDSIARYFPNGGYEYGEVVSVYKSISGIEYAVIRWESEPDPETLPVHALLVEQLPLAGF